MLTNNLIKKLNNALSPKNVLSDLEERYVYSVDASNTPDTQSSIPDAIVFVENIEQVQKVVEIANKEQVPIICRGAGTNTVGACVATHGGIILNFSKMNKIIEINPETMTAIVQTSVVVGEFQREVEKLGLFYPPDPSNLKIKKKKKKIAQNSAGARCFKYGAPRHYSTNMLVVMAIWQARRS